MRWPAALLVCMPLAAGVARAQSSQGAMRDRVREGKIGTCITGSVAASDPDRVIVLHRHRLITPGNPPFEYRFNSCSGPYCVPPESDC